jgi:ubiquinone/menaquinone biosynthesis C-methylase UbiE
LNTETAPAREEALNLRTYNAPKVADYYANLNRLTPCERLLFRNHIKPGMSVLDLGVGGGRTTFYLSRVASRYVGVDYSEAMIQICRGKFPDLDFRLTDASDLSVFPSASFDAIVFPFNGLDYVVPDEKRKQCLRECHRVLRPEGVFLFSSHSPLSILVRPAWDRGRVRAFARKFVPQRHACFRVAVGAMTVAKAIQALIRAGINSISRMLRRFPSMAFWRGEGELFDPTDGGLITHCWVPNRVTDELAKFGFQLVTCLGNDYPLAAHALITDWYYYVFLKAKIDSIDRELCA